MTVWMAVIAAGATIGAGGTQVAHRVRPNGPALALYSTSLFLGIWLIGFGICLALGFPWGV